MGIISSMKEAKIIVRTKDQKTFEKLPDLAELSTEAAKLSCSASVCGLKTESNEPPLSGGSFRVFSRFICENATSTNGCIDCITDAVDTYDEASDALEFVDSTMKMTPLREGEPPSMTYIDLTQPE